MKDLIPISIKTGGQWLVTPLSSANIFCRESFTNEHKDIETLINDFSKNRSIIGI